MSEELTVVVTIDRSFGFTADIAVERGSTILHLKEKLAALDPTGNTQASTFAVGCSPRHDGEAVRALPDGTLLTEEHLALDVCPLPSPETAPAAAAAVPAPAPAAAAPGGAAGAPAGGSSADAAREAARQAARQAQAARKEREAAAAKAKADEEARKKAEAEAARARFQAQAQAAGAGQPGAYAQPQHAHPGPWPAAQPQQPPPAPAPSLFGVPVAEDDGETRVKGVSADGRYVFAYVGGLRHPHDVLALVELFKGEASIEDLQMNRARFVYAGGTQDKATSVQVQKEVIIEAAGLEKGDYELASFAHDNMKRQLNNHLTKDNCVVMFGGKCLKIVAQHGI
mmetsp:Transcript_106655/g.339615  ORF Transcript_106655/g.339615 Transcript_106655/m.339615 type:complete len:341 (-) Transcript_106655:61-1083(-)